MNLQTLKILRVFTPKDGVAKRLIYGLLARLAGRTNLFQTCLRRFPAVFTSLKAEVSGAAVDPNFREGVRSDA